MLIVAAIALSALSPGELAERFGRREAFYGAALSPDGAHVTYLNPTADRSNTLVRVDVADGSIRPILTTGNIERSIDSCFWIKNDRLLCRVGRIEKASGFTIANSYLISLSANGGDIRLHDRYAFLDRLADNPDEALFATGWEGDVGVERVNLRTGRHKEVERIHDASMVATDEQGVARLRWLRQYHSTASQIRAMRPEMSFSYRPIHSSQWLPLGNADLSSNLTFSALGFDETGAWIYTAKPLNGRMALYRVAADGSGREELVLARPDVDVDELRRIGKHDRPVGAVYTDDFEHTSYFDPALAALASKLQSALPGRPPVNLIDESWDGAKLLMFAGSDVDPGAYYLYDRTTRHLGKLSDIRPDLAGLTLAGKRPIRYPAADGTSIPAYLTLPPGGEARNLPVIVMPHGGPAARDTRGFDWLSQFFAQMGYVVLQPNYRGSSGYGETWFASNGFRNWRTAISDINTGARWLIAQGIADPRRMAIFGWSYGGYAALQANVVEPNLYRATIAVAPVTDLDRLRASLRGYSNSDLLAKFIGSGSEASAGSPAQHADVFRSPVLMFHGTVDLMSMWNSRKR